MKGTPKSIGSSVKRKSFSLRKNVIIRCHSAMENSPSLIPVYRWLRGVNLRSQGSIEVLTMSVKVENHKLQNIDGTMKKKKGSFFNVQTPKNVFMKKSTLHLGIKLESPLLSKSTLCSKK